MKKVSSVALAAVFLSTAGFASAEEVSGSFCKVSDVRISNTGQGTVAEKVWEFKEATLPAEPVMGRIDVACADRGAPRSETQDFGKSIWFNVSGPEGGPASAGRLEASDAKLVNRRADAGLSIKGLAIYSKISPRHDCIYTVSVWQKTCSGQ